MAANESSESSNGVCLSNASNKHDLINMLQPIPVEKLKTIARDVSLVHGESHSYTDALDRFVHQHSRRPKAMTTPKPHPGTPTS